MRDAARKAESRCRVIIEMNLESVVRHFGERVDEIGSNLPAVRLPVVSGQQVIKVVCTRRDRPSVHGVGASSRMSPFDFRSAQNSDGIGWLNQARFFSNCSTVRVPAMKLGIAGWATTN